MIEITSKIVEAASHIHGWSPKKVRHALSVLGELYPEGVIDWEESDEDWGRVISASEAVAYVSVKCPLAFIQTDDEEVAQRVSSELGILAIPISDFDSPSLSVEPSVLSELTQRPLTENISYDKVSVNEIWWATV